MTDRGRLGWTIQEQPTRFPLPFRRIYFGCSKHTSSTLQRHFGFVWNEGKEATVNTQLLIVHYNKKEQCDQRGHSQLIHGYSGHSLGLVLDSSQRM